MKLHMVTPWSDDKDLGKAYNEVMQSVGGDDWVCFTDMDAMHTTYFAPLHMKRIIQQHKGYGLFTAVTNRVFNREQIPYPEYWAQNDMDFHRAIGEALLQKHGTDVIEAKQAISGVVILTSKDAWLRSVALNPGCWGLIMNTTKQSGKQA